jgi:hypothetical protein
MYLVSILFDGFGVILESLVMGTVEERAAMTCGEPVVQVQSMMGRCIRICEEGDCLGDGLVW